MLCLSLFFEYYDCYHGCSESVITERVGNIDISTGGELGSGFYISIYFGVVGFAIYFTLANL